MYRYPILLCLLALFASACAETDNLLQAQASNPDAAANTGSDTAGSEFTQKGFALVMDPSDPGETQDCVLPYDPSCSELGPDDQKTCVPIGPNMGKCGLYTSDKGADYDPTGLVPTSTQAYISCPGTGNEADDEFCATKNPNVNAGDYVAQCIVTERTMLDTFFTSEYGRCAYFMKKELVAAGTPCEKLGYLIPSSTPDNDPVNSATPDLSKAQAETCDGTDNDCDGSVDEGVKTTFYADSDTDTFGNPNVTSDACSAPMGYVANDDDCNDASSAIKPGATETCDGTDNDCDESIDEGVKTTFYADSDTDTFGNPNVTSDACSAPMGYVSNDDDCNDASSAMKPGATEVCNLADDDCDGSVDEGVQTTFYADSDMDTYGNLNAASDACSAPMGYVTNANDCNDASSAIKPGATEVCNLADDDCDGSVDENVQTIFYADSDSDQYGNLAMTTYACAAPMGYVADNSDCNDAAASVHPNATESCNETDDDCDGLVDEGMKTTFYADMDMDSYGDMSSTTDACTAPMGYVANDDDCDDNALETHPNATETCNQVDDDCDGTTDLDENDDPLCDTSCPTVQKFACGDVVEIDFSTLPNMSTLSSYNCWTAVGAKTNPNNFASPEMFLAPDAVAGTKFSFQFTTPGTGAFAALLHGTCEANPSSTNVTAYNPSKGLNGTCSAFGTTSVNGGIAGTDYVAVDKLTATGTVSFNFTCTPPTP